MPKVRDARGGRSGQIRRNHIVKYRIGTRDSGVPAMQLSTEDLRERLTNPNTRKRDLKNINAALNKRGGTE